jgi:hypothetical protein
MHGIPGHDGQWANAVKAEDELHIDQPYADLLINVVITPN